MYFWVCTVCSLLHCCASSSSVTKRRTKKRGGEGIFWHVSDALERRMPSEISFVKFERMEAVKSATSIFLSVKTESVFWELKAELESFDILTILLFVVKNVTTMQETQSKPWISIFSVICLIWSAQKQVRLRWKCQYFHWAGGFIAFSFYEWAENTYSQTRKCTFIWIGYMKYREKQSNLSFRCKIWVFLYYLKVVYVRISHLEFILKKHRGQLLTTVTANCIYIFTHPWL